MRARAITSLVLTALAGIAVYLHFEEPNLLSALAREDGPIEYLQAGLYFLASLGFVIGLSRLGSRNIWYIGYALLFFLIAGEEISWGQRLLGIETPEELARINEQSEINLHNIRGLHGSIRAIGLIVTFGICFLIPWAYRWVKPVRELIQRWKHPVFPIWAWIPPILGFLFMAVPRATTGMNFELDEIGELYLAVAMFIFGLSVLRDRRPTPMLT